ncbi:MAG TPA: hypothetical protein VEJ63_02065, partial [Planctomycetota bacterium]|nr:hypothetical protein [Planctomycetota bacterium]
MLIDRSHKGWIVFTIVAFIAATAYYVFYSKQYYTTGNLTGPTGGTWPGLTYGIIGFAMMIFCGLLGIRRRVRVWKIGRGQAWLRAHIWLGLLAYPLILYHAGMKFGWGLTFWMMVLFTIVLVSGIIGVILQNVIPRSMLVRVPAETTFEQIPHVVNVLRNEADQIVASVCGALGNEKVNAEPVGAAAAVGTMKREGAVQGKVVKTKARPVHVIEGSAPLKTFYLTEVQPFLNPEFKSDSRLAVQRSAIALFSHTRTL